MMCTRNRPWFKSKDNTTSHNERVPSSHNLILFRTPISVTRAGPFPFPQRIYSPPVPRVQAPGFICQACFQLSVSNLECFPLHLDNLMSCNYHWAPSMSRVFN